MKNKILEILDSEVLPINDKDNELVAQQICDLFDVRLSLPTDIQIEETADVAYKFVRKHFPINDEYCYTQGYIGGMTALRNNIRNNEA